MNDSFANGDPLNPTTPTPAAPELAPYFELDVVTPVATQPIEALTGAEDEDTTLYPLLEAVQVTPYGVFVGELQDTFRTNTKSGFAYRQLAGQQLALELEKRSKITADNIASFLGGAAPMEPGEKRDVVAQVTAKLVAASAEFGEALSEEFMIELATHLNDLDEAEELFPQIPRTLGEAKLSYIDVLFAAQGGQFKAPTALLLYYGSRTFDNLHTLLVASDNPASVGEGRDLLTAYMTWRRDEFLRLYEQRFGEIIDDLVAGLPAAYRRSTDETVEEVVSDTSVGAAANDDA